MKHITTEKREIINLNYTLKGVNYRVIATEQNEDGEWIDTVKNLTTKESKQFEREQLYKYTR